MPSILFKPDTPSPQRSPRRLPTDPLHEHSSEMSIRTYKRIVVCCDGTWQDGVANQERSSYTNILRLARTINHEDGRLKPAIPQVVFYQSGIGSDKNFYSRYVEGTTGGSLGDKVEEAYAFIAHNYHPGDEIFLFGFSRGAYTARMVAMFIGEIGVLDRRDMDHFAGIFLSYQRLGKCSDPQEIKTLKQKLAPWTRHDSHGKLRADSNQTSFRVKCVGVFDTVGSFGLPEELGFGWEPEVQTMFGFPDKILGEHVERAYQALALNETRKDFNCAKFEQTEAGRRKKQVLKQCWFTGSHTDIGGGYPQHDLSDMSLTWMAAQIEDMLSLDVKYLSSLYQPCAPWGKLAPHDPSTGVFLLARNVKRPLPAPNEITRETIHSSVLEQDKLDPDLVATVKKYPELVAPLNPLEQELRLNWPFGLPTLKNGAKAAAVSTPALLKASQ
ncbi:hypothetical protein Hypma_015566 [Hypsizygus marmoreus]|uniref:T6SS Phospholipase effector Tle1-like catalytic domain-containing protein n=1 Tax=Hypsizygus marmoreus TaxID=39966 RepID=A0A369K7H3_HYPMA|nr:hypothetical protein Hypma_015566 [Hypsizygus marmoreus]